MREWHEPTMLPVDVVQIYNIRLAVIRLGKNIFIREQLENCIIFQESQGTTQSCLVGQLK